MRSDPYAELAELAGGFIHEIKNHLSTLGLNLQLLAEDFQDPQSQRERRAFERVQRLQGECQRLVDVSNDFLRFARIKDLELHTGEAGRRSSRRWSISSARLLGRRTSRSSPIVPADLPPVPLDLELFKQALLNLMLNAGPGHARRRRADDSSGRDTGRRVELCLIDTGKGMPPEVLEQGLSTVLLDEVQRQRPGTADGPQDRRGPRRPHRRAKRGRQGHAVRAAIAGHRTRVSGAVV